MLPDICRRRRRNCVRFRLSSPPPVMDNWLPLDIPAARAPIEIVRVSASHYNIDSVSAPPISIPSRLHQIHRPGMKRLIPLLPKRASPKFMTSPVVCPATSCRKAIASQSAAIQQARRISIVARATWNECEAPISSCTREAPAIRIGRNICAVCGQTKTCKEFRNKAGRLKLRRRSWNSNSQTPSEQYHQLVGGRGNIITFT